MASSSTRLCALVSGLWVLAGVWLLYTRPVQGQASAVDGVQLLLGRLQEALDREDDQSFPSVFHSSVPADDLSDYRNELMRTGVIRRVIRERDRLPLEGVPSGEGYRVFVEIFEEMPGRARVITADLTVQRPSSGGVDSWRISKADGLSAVQGLFRLRLDTSQQYAAQNLTIEAPDLVLTLKTGSVFLINCDEGVTGLVLLGEGVMRFTPGPESERGQLRLFAGADSLTATFDSALIRLNPEDYQQRVAASALRSVPVDARAASRAADIVERELPKSLTVDLREVSTHTWHLLPREGDLLAEIRTKVHGTLTFARFGAQAEDVSLVRRDRRLTIALYPSSANLAERGRFYSDDLVREYDVLNYDIDASVIPARRFLRARVRLDVRTRTSIFDNDTAPGGRARGDERDERARWAARISAPERSERVARTSSRHAAAECKSLADSDLFGVHRIAGTRKRSAPTTRRSAPGRTRAAPASELCLALVSTESVHRLRDRYDAYHGPRRVRVRRQRRTGQRRRVGSRSRHVQGSEGIRVSRERSLRDIWHSSSADLRAWTSAR